MTGYAGFLVVRTVQPERPGVSSSLRSRYLGIDRVPPYPADDENESEAMDQYVFGGCKDDTTNLIPSLDVAVRLQHALSASKYTYEILFCCEDREASSRIERDVVALEHLGYDVATVRGDYWSIVAEIPPTEWALRFRSCLNEFGLFDHRSDADAYRAEYRRRSEPDSDAPLDVVYVARVQVQPSRSEVKRTSVL